MLKGKVGLDRPDHSTVVVSPSVLKPAHAAVLCCAADSGKLKLNRETLRSRFYKYSNSALPWLGPLTETCTLKACIFRELQRKGFTLYYR